MADDIQTLKNSVLRLLARRDYCSYEIRQKYHAKFSEQLIEQVLSEFEEKGYLSNQRFVLSFVRNKIYQGFGLKRIQYDLQQKQIAADLLEQTLEELNYDWYQLAEQVQQKRFKKPAEDYKEFSKQMCYLLQRGFSMEQAQAAIKYQT